MFNFIMTCMILQVRVRMARVTVKELLVVLVMVMAMAAVVESTLVDHSFMQVGYHKIYN